MTDNRLDRRDLLKATGAGMLAVGASGVARATDGNDAGTEETTEIDDWHDLDAVRDDIDGDYVLVNDLDEDTDGYDDIVDVNKTVFDEFFSGPVEAGDEFELFYDNVSELLSAFDTGAGEEIDLDDTELTEPETGLIEVLIDLEGSLFIQYEIQNPEFVGFDPMGGFTDPLAGTFDGQGHEIRDFQINRPTDTQNALFAYTGEIGTDQEGVIENLRVAASEATGGFETALIAAEHRGRIVDSTASGTVTVPNSNTAGLVAGTTEGEIVRSGSEGDVECDSASGGLTGRVLEDGTVENSFSDGNIIGGSRAGGLVGLNTDFGEIESSFATGAVNGDTAVGGVVGENEDDGIVTDTYWDMEATGQQDGIGDGQGDTTGLDTDEMQGEAAAENMAALDFEETWVTRVEDYPVLRWQVPPTVPGGTGPPRDLNGDGLYEDIDGDGGFDIFDVQALFNGLDSDAVQNNPEAFNFNEDKNPEDVTIFDVQGLFNRL